MIMLNISCTSYMYKYTILNYLLLQKTLACNVSPVVVHIDMELRNRPRMIFAYKIHNLLPSIPRA